MTTQATRIEHDLLGDKAVPADAYYGVQTARALENFHISGVPLRLYPEPHQGVRDGEDGRGARQPRLRAVHAARSCTGIEEACQELIDGKLHDQFRLDVFQGGAGTSTNMNANEVIANRGARADGPRRRASTSTAIRTTTSTARSRPTTPTRRALHVGMALGNVELVAAVKELIAAFRAKGKEFADDPEDGPDAAAGRRADDARPGVRGVRRDARGRGPRARGDRARALRSQHGRAPRSAPA